jgi:hypothetical protein
LRNPEIYARGIIAIEKYGYSMPPEIKASIMKRIETAIRMKKETKDAVPF